MANKRFQVHYVDSSHASRNVVVLAGNETEAVEKIKRQRRDVGRVVAVRAMAEQETGEDEMNIDEMNIHEVKEQMSELAGKLSPEEQVEMVRLTAQWVNLSNESVNEMQQTMADAIAVVDKKAEALSEQIEENAKAMTEAVTEVVGEALDEYLHYAFFGNLDEEDGDHPGLIGLLDIIINASGLSAEEVFRKAAAAGEKSADRGSPGSAWAAGVSDNASERNKARVHGQGSASPVGRQGTGDRLGVVKEDVEVGNGHDPHPYGRYHSMLMESLQRLDEHKTRFGR